MEAKSRGTPKRPFFDEDPGFHDEPKVEEAPARCKELTCEPLEVGLGPSAVLPRDRDALGDSRDGAEPEGDSIGRFAGDLLLASMLISAVDVTEQIRGERSYPPNNSGWQRAGRSNSGSPR